jgi:hypothetical protein
VRIRILKPPPGEAPEHVRQAWLGLVLPVVARCRGPARVVAFGVLSGPRNWVHGLLQAILGRAPQEVGYCVYCTVAIDILRAACPDAADWWSRNTPHLLKRGYFFVFPPESCEELP